MQTAEIVIAIVVSLIGLRQVAAEYRVYRGTRYINDYRYPSGVFRRLQKKRPDLSAQDCELVGLALKQFFLAYLKSGRRFVSMPSQAADDLWHEMILYTKAYQYFCRKAFGRFLHHTPAAALGSVRATNAGLRRCWWHACREERLNPRTPARLPLLFGLDDRLHIADGFHYVLDCQGVRDARQGTTVIHCGSDFADPDFDGSLDGFGDDRGGWSVDGDGGSDGGCGGGCGGGD